MPENIGESISNIFKRLESFLKTKTVVGEPIQIGEITLVPFIEVSFGMGSSASGAGSGGHFSPSAVLVIAGGQVQLLPIKKSGGLEQFIDLVPDIMEKVKEHKDTKATDDE